MEENYEGVNESEAAEQTEEVTEVENGEGTVEETTEPELDRNAIYADARRRAESEARRKQEAFDARIADRFKGFTNPLTGKPIQSAQDYFDALDAQDSLATKKTLADNGIDPNLIEKAVNNSPAIRTANAIIASQRQKEVVSQIENDVKAITQIDPDIKSVDDILTGERFPDVLRYVDKNKLSLVDAYKLVYADKLSQRKTEAVKQQAINNVRSQQHLTPTDGGAGKKDTLKEIPQSQLRQWQEFFPNKSPKELREAYNASLHE